MRINAEVMNAIAKGLPTTLNYLNLDFNTLEKEGVAFLTRQLENG